MFKVNNKDTRMTPLASFWCHYCKLWTYFTPCSSVGEYYSFHFCLISLLCYINFFRDFSSLVIPGDFSKIFHHDFLKQYPSCLLPYLRFRRYNKIWTFYTHGDIINFEVREPTWHILRSTPPKLFLGKGVLKICSKHTGKHLCWTAILIKLRSNFIEITLRRGCFPVNLLHIFRTPLTKNTSRELLLWIADNSRKDYCSSYKKFRY